MPIFNYLLIFSVRMLAIILSQVYGIPMNNKEGINMNDTLIEKRESRSEKSKEWRMSNGAGHFLDVVFSIDLENRLRTHRSSSFSRFQSEQLNKLEKLVSGLTHDYRLTIDEEAVGLAFLPLESCAARKLMQQLKA